MTKNRIARMITTGLFAAGMLFCSVPVMAAEVFATEPTPMNEDTNIPVLFARDTVCKSSTEITGVLDEKVEKYTEGQLLGKTLDGLARVNVDGKELAVDPAAFVYTPEEIQALKDQKQKEEEEKKKAEEEARRKAEEEKKKQEEARKAAQPAAVSSGWAGSVLSRSAGVNYGPSGKETYYNLNMSGVVNIMRSMGNQDPYWVRNDGVKMLGGYVMVAANLGVHPRGSLVPTSLGMGIVCDTGGFAHGNPTQLDIATAW